jgi:hypothetical protein
LKDFDKTRDYMNISRQMKLGATLILLSITTYLIHYLIFRDAEAMLSYVTDEIAFVFIQVLVVTLIIDNLLEKRERENRLEKLNMVIGTFFSEIGTEMLSYFSDLDPNLETLRKDLLVRESWSDKEFNSLSARLKASPFRVQPDKLNLERLREYVMGKRDFLLIMMENPNLIEHETFTELLRSVFHLVEELKFRKKIESLPEEDLVHIAGDINRAYGMLVNEWVAYMKHLKNNYPYLFSLAMRTNPFDQQATVVLGDVGRETAC